MTSHVVRASLGESLRLVCPVISDPPPYIDWTKDGDAIHIGWQRYRIRSHDSVLVVRDVEPSDAGFFRCIAVNGFGSVEYTFSVIVRPPGEYHRHATPSLYPCLSLGVQDIQDESIVYASSMHSQSLHANTIRIVVDLVENRADKDCFCFVYETQS